MRFLLVYTCTNTYTHTHKYTSNCGFEYMCERVRMCVCKVSDITKNVSEKKIKKIK